MRKKLKLTRLEANMEIISLLSLYLKCHPSERFGQALVNLYVCNDSFFVESVDTLAEIKKTLKRYKSW